MCTNRSYVTDTDLKVIKHTYFSLATVWRPHGLVVKGAEFVIRKSLVPPSSHWMD